MAHAPCGLRRGQSQFREEEISVTLHVPAIPNYTFIPNTGVLDQLFHKSALTISVFGYPNPPYSLNLVGFLIILVIAIAANTITERLTSRKVGLFTAVVITILGTFLVSAYVTLPFDISVEGVRLVGALLGAIIIAVFYALIRGTVSSGK